MTGVFYMPLQQHRGGTDTRTKTEKESAQTVNSKENYPAAPAVSFEPAVFRSLSQVLNAES